MAQIIHPLKLPLSEVNFVQGLVSLFFHHPQPFFGAVRLLQKQAHIGFCFFGGKANVVQRQNDTEPLQIFVIVLPYTHHFLTAPHSPQLSYSCKTETGIL